MLSLYLHIPFCRVKCDYCDFFSVTGASAAQMADYVDQLCRQLDLTAPRWSGPVRSISLGGGTPSLLEPAAVARIVAAAAAAFTLAADCEITLEANPGTVSAATLDGYRAAGVNRLSLGIQSLAPRHLRGLGRLHDREQALAAVESARHAGIANLSLDLIFALPGQTKGDLAADLDGLLALAPEHLSCYVLSAEEGTPLARRVAQGILALPDEETAADFFLQVHEQLARAGYRHYEISNYARPGYECRHNLGYWRRQSSLGLGAGAHSFADRGHGIRYAAAPDLPAFAAALAAGRDPAVELESFDRQGAMAETLYLGLRTADGVDDAAFRERFGSGVAAAFPAAVAACAPHLSCREGQWRFDLQGWLLYDHLISHFL